MKKLNPLVRLVLAVLLGMVIASCVIVLGESVNSKLYPLKITNPTVSDYAESIKTLPLAAFLIVVLTYIVSSFFGGYVAGRIAPFDKKIIAALTVGFFLLLGGIVNFITIPHPLWVTLISCCSYMVFTYLGAKIASTKLKD